MVDEAQVFAWLRLYRSERVGPQTFRTLIERYGDAQTALEAIPELARRAETRRPPKVADPTRIEAELKALRSAGAEVILSCDEDFSPWLRHANDSPPLLTYRGDHSLLKRDCVAMVGARNASANGRLLAAKVAKELGGHGYVIASGLARGIDTAAHQASLDTGTIAVVAGGLDVIYPPENKQLWHDIAERGLILAEMPWGSQPTARAFPHRNRIIAGLSRALLVVEAARRSGSLISARLAGEMGREVFAMPGSPLDARAEGANHLLKNGAHLATEAEDIRDLLESLPGLDLQEQGDLFDLEDKPPVPPQDDIDRVRAQIWALLGPSPCPVDELARQCQVSAHLVHIALVELELAGRIERLPGQGIARAYA